jgi:endonuclease G
MKKLLFVFALLVSAPVFASPCDDKFPKSVEVKVPNTTVLCNTFYATVFDEAHNAAIFSTEIAQVKTDKVTRKNDFHADKRLKNGPTPDDYSNSGYDRGHMTPAADASTDEQMSDTFLMTNMTPQEPTVNRTPWRLLEVRVRDGGPFEWVVTGAVYSYPAKTIGKNNVTVPVSYYKIVYLADGKIQAFEAENKPNSPVVESTLEAVQKKSGIAFPK